MLGGEPVTSNGEAGGASPVATAELYRAADLRGLDFETTAQLEPLEGVVAQQRALDAIRLGAGIEKAGFNIFAIGRTEARMRPAVETVLSQSAGKRAGPRDWVYVNNFKDARRPVAIALPAGRAAAFQEAMTDLIEDLKVAVPAAFESEEYQTERAAIEEQAHKPQNEALAALQQKAAAQGIGLVRTPMGFALLPIEKGEVVPPDAFNAWPEGKRQRVQERIEGLEKDLEHFVRQIPQWEKGRRDAVREAQPQDDQGRRGPSDRRQAEPVRGRATHCLASRPGAVRSRRQRRHVHPRHRRWRERGGGHDAAGRTVRPLPGERAGRPAERRQRPDHRGAAPHAGQSDGLDRASVPAGRAGHQLPADQGGGAASRQWRLSAARRAQPSDRGIQLAGAQAGAAAAGDRHRGCEPPLGPEQHGVAGAGPHSARRPGGAVRRQAALLHPGGHRSGGRGALQGAGRFRRRGRPLGGERSDLRPLPGVADPERGPQADGPRRRLADDRACRPPRRRCRQAHHAGRPDAGCAGRGRPLGGGGGPRDHRARAMSTAPSPSGSAAPPASATACRK